MYGRGTVGYAGGRRTMAPYGRPFPPRFMMGLVIGGLFLFLVVGPAFQFFPLLFLLIWAVPLLVALARHGELSPALAALETSLSVAEANRMLSDLANSGHVEVRAHEGRLGYALWERDRRELTDR